MRLNLSFKFITSAAFIIFLAFSSLFLLAQDSTTWPILQITQPHLATELDTGSVYYTS